MMSQPGRLAAFLAELPSRRGDGEELELVIAGDFIDFLAVEPFAAWTPDPAAARQKLERTMGSAAFSPVFDTLAGVAAAGCGITVLIGNHDLEMALPSVQAALRERLQAGWRRLRFVDDGRACRYGGALIEHGNRYDGANRNDWAGLRALASQESRGEAQTVQVKVSAGSEIVHRVVNPLKASYPFIDLLQPSGELLALLLLAFEPALKRHWRKIGRLLRGGWRQVTYTELPPGELRFAAAGAAGDWDEELAEAFGEDYEILHREATGDAYREAAFEAAGEWWSALSSHEGLAALLDAGRPVPGERLRQIRATLSRLLPQGDELGPGGPCGHYGEHARRLREARDGDVEVVIMGHTHLARHLGPADRAGYINTGTWADIVRPDRSTLLPTTDEELLAYLDHLRRDPPRRLIPTYAELVLEPGGSVRQARLRTADPP